MNPNERQLQKERREGDGRPTTLGEEQQAQAHTLKEVEEREARRRNVDLSDSKSTTNAEK